jgi:hypothetical protein
MEFQPIYRLGSKTDTLDVVIKTFAAVYWDTPRKPKAIVAGDTPLTATFELTGGYRKYRIAPSTETNYAYEISVAI